ncbi:MAG: spore germination protein [Firmicutes bacterium]|nr:spore germination protein [Bacillota bacterium]
MLKKLIKRALSQTPSDGIPGSETMGVKIKSSLIENEKYIRNQFGNTRDLVIRHLTIAGRAQAMLVYLDNMIDIKVVNEHLMEPLMERRQYPVDDMEDLIRTVIQVGQIKTSSKMDELLGHVLYGNTALFIDNMPQAVVFETKGWEHRSVDKPDTEKNVLGPKEAFTETAMVNQTMLRRRIRSTRLRFELMKVGEITQTDIVVTYIDGLAKPELIKELKRRIKKVKIDGVFCCGFFKELLDDNPLSPFPTMEGTERPDKMTAALLEGRVGLIIDGTPFALIIPTMFWDFLMTPDDYYSRFYSGTFLRLLRLAAVAITLTLPSLYIAITTHHQEMLPTALALSIAGAREGVPFSAFIEAVLMELAFELVREGGVRLPAVVGQAVSIVGALVLGQSGVEAGIVSSTMVIVVATTGIASFAIPGYSAANTIRLLRFPLMVLSGLWGLPGLVSGLLIIFCHMISLSSFGTSYLYPVAPVKLGAWKDVAIRVPWWAMATRPKIAANKKRLRPFIPPGKQDGDQGAS